MTIADRLRLLTPVLLAALSPLPARVDVLGAASLAAARLVLRGPSSLASAASMTAVAVALHAAGFVAQWRPALRPEGAAACFLVTGWHGDPAQDDIDDTTALGYALASPAEVRRYNATGSAGARSEAGLWAEVER